VSDHFIVTYLSPPEFASRRKEVAANVPAAIDGPFEEKSPCVGLPVEWDCMRSLLPALRRKLRLMPPQAIAAIREARQKRVVRPNGGAQR
jgi:hypothetical protein